MIKQHAYYIAVNVENYSGVRRLKFLKTSRRFQIDLDNEICCVATKYNIRVMKRTLSMLFFNTFFCVLRSIVYGKSLCELLDDLKLCKTLNLLLIESFNIVL